jgi:CDP-glucose 4,6-dehydratase
MEITTFEDLKNFYKDRKVLVTGYNGFKGTWLSLWLKHLGATVFGVGLEPGKLATDVRLDSIVDGRLITDIGYDYQQLKNAMMDFQPDVVFHLAAQPLVRLSYEAPRETYQTNVMGTMNVLAACVAADIQSAVFITTDKCYENNESGYPMRETDGFGGSDPYSSSKGCCEILIESMRRSFPECAPYFSARAGNVIGGGDWAEDRIVPDFFRANRNLHPLLIRNPSSVRPWQHVLEPLYGYLLLGMRNDATGFGVNFGPYPNEGHTVGEVVNGLNACLEEANEVMVEITIPKQNDETKKEAKLLQLDITRAITEIGWKPVLDFGNTIKMTADWYRKATSPDAAFQLCKEQINQYENLLV